MNLSRLPIVIPAVLVVAACGGAKSVAPVSSGTGSTSVATIDITWTGAPLAQDSTAQMTAVLRDANGSALSSRPVAWTSSDSTVASVSSSGIVTAVARTGNVTITASSEGKSGAAGVTVWWIYQSPNKYAVYVSQAFTIRDSVRQYNIPVLVRLPVGAPQPLPVVFYIYPTDSGQFVAAKWGNTFAASGYAVVHVGSPFIANSQYVCTEFHVPYCAGVILPERLVGARALSVLMDSLGAIGSRMGVTLDAAHVGVAGESAGGAVAMYLAGATVDVYPGLSVSLADSRFAAFLSNSGPALTTDIGLPSGFSDTSWAKITKPFMQQTSTGDQGGTRRLPYDRMPAGDKYLAFFATTMVDHGSFTLEAATPDSFAPLIAADGLAFFDAFLRGNAGAKQWLATNQLGRGTANVAQMSSK